MSRSVAVSAVMIMLTLFAPIVGSSNADPKVKLVKDAVVFDGNGKKMGIALDYHFPATDVTVHIGLIIGGKEYITGVRSLSFTTPGDVAVLYESTDCSGQPYVQTGAGGIDGVRANSMLDTIPIIASNDPINNPANETLWEVDNSVQPMMKEIQSRWANAAQDDLTGLPIAPRCQASGFGQLEVLPIVEVFNLSSVFTPPYYLRLR
jgi:hypothetical protein